MRAGFFFDFDGTLVDTFGGIVTAVQQQRAQLSAEPLTAEEIRRHIGWGLGHLLSRCHPTLDARRPADLPPPGQALPEIERDLPELIPQFRRIYAEVMMQGTRVYPGLAELCRRWDRRGAVLAIISNKPERFVRLILAAIGLCDPFALVLGGDSLEVRKPDPKVVRHTIRTLELATERCLMIGDGELDLEVAVAAGISSCGVTWGLLPEARVREIGATHIVRSAEELDACLARYVG
ncbi:MAG: HAD-IA family hydrolase [Candidatus Eisenbacteria bacterium]|nr:HAD-IA family hydrolase [Candidatus Eisenbacteria bacterium]